MWDKTLFIALILIIISNQVIHAALPLKYLNAIAKIGNENIIANYDQMKIKLHCSSHFTNPVSYINHKDFRDQSLTSEIGLIMMAVGGGIFTVGSLVSLAMYKGDSQSFFPDSTIVLILSWILGLGLVALGGLLALIGSGNKDSTTYRYSLVSPKPNEVGISYTFK